MVGYAPMSHSAVPLDVDALLGWLSARVEVTAPLTADQISGGRSNLTYKVTDADGQAFIVRRPPLGDLLPGAHDMGREARVMAALGPTDVPVPEVIGLEEDPEVLGSTFYAMRFVGGHILRSREDGATLDEATRDAARRSLATTLATMHALDPEALGLVKPGKGADYLARQLHVWKRQMDAQDGDRVPQAAALHDRLHAAMPPQTGNAIVHGDYRLDNVVMGADGQVQAVLDWELWTAGDPLADLGITLVYWGAEGEPDALLGRPNDHPGYGTREDFLADYVAAGGRAMPPEHLSYYLAFATWRLAAILWGVVQRNKAGAYGDAEDGWRQIERNLEVLFDHAGVHADAAGI